MHSGSKVRKFIVSDSHAAPEIHGNRISGRKMCVLMGGRRRLKIKNQTQKNIRKGGV